MLYNQENNTLLYFKLKLASRDTTSVSVPKRKQLKKIFKDLREETRRQ